MLGFYQSQDFTECSQKSQKYIYGEFNSYANSTSTFKILDVLQNLSPSNPDETKARAEVINHFASTAPQGYYSRTRIVTDCQMEQKHISAELEKLMPKKKELEEKKGSRSEEENICYHLIKARTDQLSLFNRKATALLKDFEELNRTEPNIRPKTSP